MTHPYLMVSSFNQPACDEEMLHAILRAWARVHVKNRPSRIDRRLFRSLSVAYEACRVPQAMDNILYDHGRHCSYWVSAFEALAHPGTNVGFKQVTALIGKRHLDDPRLSRRVRIRVRKQGTSPSCFMALNVAQRLYMRLYNVRNDFLHGNALSPRKFAPNGLIRGVRLLDTAPLVFHAALEGLLPMAVKPADDMKVRILSILKYKFLENAFLRAFGQE